MHDEPTMPQGNLGAQPVLEGGAAEYKSTATARRSVSPKSDQDWLSERHDRHQEAHQYAVEPVPPTHFSELDPAVAPAVAIPSDDEEAA